MGPLETLYIGGGTPSLWGRPGALFLKELFAGYGLFGTEGREWTLEVNPDSSSLASLSAFQDLGLNRFSLGIQAFHQKYLEALDRIHGIEEVKKALSLFHSKGLRFSVDIMLGLPFSKGRKVVEELKNVLHYGPEHLSLYILTVKKNYPHYKALPSEEACEEEYLKASEFLQTQGFIHYEVSNFSRPRCESQHNLRYWRSESVAALGPSAVGFFSEENIRYRWRPSYHKANVDCETLSDEGRRIEEVYLGLRTTDGIEKRFLAPSLLEAWRKRGYLRGLGERAVLGPRGFLMLDSLMDDLFSHRSI